MPILKEVLSVCEDIIQIQVEKPCSKFKYSLAILFDTVDELIDLAILKWYLNRLVLFTL